MTQKRAIVGATVIFALAGGAILVGSLDSEPRPLTPRLQFEHYAEDLGRIHEGESRVVDFPYRNTGSGDLLIHEVSAECSCQQVAISHEKLEPGMSGTLRARVHATLQGGPVADGIVVKSNDPENPRQVLRIKRFTVLDTVATPKRLTITCRVGDASPSGSFTVAGPTGDRDFNVVKVESDVETITADYRCRGMAVGDRRLWHVQVSVSQEEHQFTGLRESAELRVFTSCQTKPELIVPVTVVRDVAFEVKPKSLVFVPERFGPSRKQEIRLSYGGSAAEADVEPLVPEGHGVDLKLVSVTTHDKKTCWVYEAMVGEGGTRTSGLVDVGRIEFRFMPLGISIPVPFSIMPLGEHSTEAKPYPTPANRKHEASVLGRAQR